MRINTGPSSNVEDRRGMGGLALGGGGLGALVLGLLYMLLGGDPSGGGNGGGTTVPGASPPSRQVPADDAEGRFASSVLASTEKTWTSIFQQMGQQYEPPRLVLFDGSTSTACGFGQSAMGPFYCPRDSRVYIDLSFYRELEQRFNAPGDFAKAYVLAHEVGHHVQNLTGVSEQVQRAEQAASSKEEANAYSVRLELQADCLAGVWANQARQRGEIEIDQGDVQTALNAATAIGDDKLQEQAEGRVRPESFTHGSSAQRVEWFSRGLQSGDMKQCDTFRGA
ncbi:MAG TPA: neutral zinc metallopeptidase [Longimicrobium sp.]|nr:neutral zinc metallopeptidase [Longimicrobium sp.]